MANPNSAYPNRVQELRRKPNLSHRVYTAVTPRGRGQQRADLFQRIAFPVEDRSGGAPNVMRRPLVHPEPGNDAARRCLQIMAVQIEQPRCRVCLEMRPQQFEGERRERRDKRAAIQRPCRAAPDQAQGGRDIRRHSRSSHGSRKTIG